MNVHFLFKTIEKLAKINNNNIENWNVKQVGNIFLSPSDTVMRQRRLSFITRSMLGLYLSMYYFAMILKSDHLGKFDLTRFHLLQLDWRV